MKGLIYETKNSLSENICSELVDSNFHDNKTIITSPRLTIFLMKELFKNVIKYKNNFLGRMYNDTLSNYSIILNKKGSSFTQFNNENIGLNAKLYTNITKPKIPKIIIQTGNTAKIHRMIYNNIHSILRLNPDYSYIFITDNTAIELIKANFDTNTLNAFNKLKVGAAKGDFIRYIALYVYGGVYLDLDAGITTRLSDIIPTDTEFIFFYNSDVDPKITNWIIMSSPKNVLIKKIIDEMVIRIHNNETNIFLATGPTLFTDVIYNEINNTNIYGFKNIFSIQERVQFLNNFLLKPDYLNGLFYSIDKFADKFQFNFKGYSNSFLYSDVEKYTSDCNIFKESFLKLNVNEFTAYKYNYSTSNSLEFKDNKNMCFIWFLNDYDGEFIFCNEYKVKPERGKLLLFPNSWCITHEEVIKFGENKYVISGYFDIDIHNN